MSNAECVTTAQHGAFQSQDPGPSGSRPALTPNEIAYQDSVLIAELATVNTLLARYVLRHTDAEAGRTTPIPTADEYALAIRLATAADSIRARARRRDQHENP